uniref:heme oxygenase (biliverdin-producing) n=1 Tax=Leptobrachium leishanense TaxID=445787 RepID=A0A8C5QS02_9ANUR
MMEPLETEVVTAIKTFTKDPSSTAREMDPSITNQNASSSLGDLSEELKEATKEVHKQAEDTEFMRNFQRGQVSLEEFKLVMSSLYFIYAALEKEIEMNKENPVFSPIYFPLELHRKDTLDQDLEYFYGPQWRKKIVCPQSTKNYVNRLHHVGQTEPELLVAHAYTRYLGDLSGGQVLKKIAQKALQLPVTGEGLAFFTFDNVSSATKFKQLYRSRMNSIEMTAATKQKILQEAQTAFLLNVKVFEELQSLSNGIIQDGPEKPVVPKLRSRTPKTDADNHLNSQNLKTRAFTQTSRGPFIYWAVIVGFTLVALVGLYIL